MKENVKIIGDFNYIKNALPPEEAQQFFVDSRRHGFQAVNVKKYPKLGVKTMEELLQKIETEKKIEIYRIGAIHPFAVGGSDAGAIMGLSKWETAYGMLDKKMNPKPEKLSQKTKDLFAAGHIFENPFREIFSRKTGLKTTEFDYQILNLKYPHLVANIDGLFIKDGQTGIYEGKTTGYFTTTKEAIDEDNMPANYEAQLRFYMSVLEVPLGVLNVGWGLDINEGSKHLFLSHDDSCEEITQICENFVGLVMAGKSPELQNADIELAVRDIIKKNGKPKPKKKPVVLPEKITPIFKAYKAATEELAETKNSLAEIKKLSNLKELEAKIRSKEKDIERIATNLLPAFGNSQNAEILVDGTVFDLTYKLEEKPCFDMEVKGFFKAEYPEVYEEVMNRKIKQKASVGFAENVYKK